MLSETKKLGRINERLLLAQEEVQPLFEEIEAIALVNQKRVLQAFHENKLTEEHFAERTGYGLDDPGRTAIDCIFAHVMGAEAAAVRLQLVSGTHALACALLGNLKAGDRLVSVTGKPYDTLQPIIGIANELPNESPKILPGSLRELGVEYAELEWEDIQSTKDNQSALALLAPPTKFIYIQKSCGYSFSRKSLPNREIESICKIVKIHNPNLQVIVDNCYGEFVEDKEPTACGADLVAGSLIKNPGGGLAVGGGYFAGKKALVDAALHRLTAPGIGGHQGLLYNQGRLLLQGLFLAPSVVANAVKGSHLLASVLVNCGFSVKPLPYERRYDIIQAVALGSRERLMTFCQAVQAMSPVNAHVIPEPSNMPGYHDKVVMAGGTFIEGSTIELSADGPLRPPFVAYMQGGLTYYHVQCLAEYLLDLFENPTTVS